MEELSALINQLENIGNSSDELYDTDVKEQMNEVIVEIFINEKDEYQVPDSFGMFSQESDRAIQQAFAQLQSALRNKNINYKAKLDLLSRNGIISNNGQISECFFGEITQSTLSDELESSPYSWLQYEWVYYLFLIVPGAALFTITYIFSPYILHGLWYIPLFVVIMLTSFFVGDKLWRFFADNSFRKKLKKFGNN